MSVGLPEAAVRLSEVAAKLPEEATDDAVSGLEIARYGRKMLLKVPCCLRFRFSW